MTTRIMYRAVMNTLSIMKPYTTKFWWSPATLRISSLAQKPDRGTSPAMDSAPRPNTAAVTGIRLARPPRSATSCRSVAWITEPAERKRSALKKPWANRYSMAAVTEPEPRATIISPRLLMVE